MKDLGFDQIINNPKNIVAIEWGEKIKKIMPKNAID
jgi:tRNA A37 threonylcarbamoyladenosine biosynthesis protein TsaE